MQSAIIEQPMDAADTAFAITACSPAAIVPPTSLAHASCLVLPRPSLRMKRRRPLPGMSRAYCLVLAPAAAAEQSSSRFSNAAANRYIDQRLIRSRLGSTRHDRKSDYCTPRPRRSSVSGDPARLVDGRPSSRPPNTRSYPPVRRARPLLPPKSIITTVPIPGVRKLSRVS